MAPVRERRMTDSHLRPRSAPREPLDSVRWSEQLLAYYYYSPITPTELDGRGTDDRNNMVQNLAYAGIPGFPWFRLR